MLLRTHRGLRLRWMTLGLVGGILVASTTALAGSGVGGVFNLGQGNTVDAQTSLTGNPGGSPELKVTSTGTAAAVRGVATNGVGTNGISTAGVGQQGVSNSGTGALGTHANTTGTSPGVQGETNSTDPAGAGVVGKNNGGGPGLRAIVNAGAPPLAVNSSVKVSNLNADLLDGLDSAALPYWKLSGNAGTSPATNFLGTTDNQPLELKVNGQRALRLEPGSSPNLIGGSAGNEVKDGASGVVIAGGGTSVDGNIGYDNQSTIGGGQGNRVGTTGGDPTDAPASTIAGGYHNTAGAGSGDTIAGGESNGASSGDSTVAGGIGNTADGYNSTVAGGQQNLASGSHSTVVGGALNKASGDGSFAAGENAIASGQGSFVWSDNQFASQITSPADFSFTAHAIGGFNLWTNSSGPNTGCTIAAGGGSWVCSSSRYVKDDFVHVNRNEILRRLAAIPITTWHYKNERAGVRHIGPMAQDFAHAFHFGQSTTGIATVDADGVSLAAIQGLYRQNRHLETENERINARLSRLERQLDRLSRKEAQR
jgi:hypothetical protein